GYELPMCGECRESLPLSVRRSMFDVRRFPLLSPIWRSLPCRQSMAGKLICSSEHLEGFVVTRVRIPLGSLPSLSTAAGRSDCLTYLHNKSTETINYPIT